MDNFRRPARPRRGSAVDGIIGTQHNAPNRKRLGDFKKTSGFHGTGKSATASPNDIVRRASLGSQVEQRQRMPKIDLPGGPTPDKKDKKVKKEHKWRTLAKRTSVALAVMLLVGGGYVGAKAYMKSRQVLKGGGQAAALNDEVDPSQLNGEGDGRINIMLMGRGGDGHEGPDLTDTILVASIDPIQKEAALISIPRDFWVKPKGGAGYSKINSVYANAKYAVLNGKKIDNQEEEADKAGQEATEKVVEDILGIPVHYHAMVDFEAFRKAIDTVGGVDVDVKTQLYDPTVAWENNWNSLIAPVGQQHFDGKKALLYVRSRHGSARGDFDRSERQREVILALKTKVLSLGTFSNPVKVTQLLDAFGDHVSTNFSTGEVMKLYNIGKEIDASKVTSIGLADPPNDFVTTSMASGQSVVVPKAGIGEYAAIHNYIRNTVKDSYIKKENPSIIVLNGTGRAGLATAKADELKSYGYNVVKVEDAPTQDYTNTVFVNLRGDQKKYTQHYLQKRLNVAATGKLPDGINPETADFVIIVGQNAGQDS